MKLLLVTLMLAVPLATPVTAADLPAADAALIESAGVPLYPGAAFATGNKDVGFRFATSDEVASVREWYREKMGDWRLFDEYGSWILYPGEPVEGLGELMSRHQPQVQTNENHPEWHSVDKAMTTEIVIMVVE